jgi:hypothetical protein
MAFKLSIKFVVLILVVALLLSLYVAIKSKCSCEKCPVPVKGKEGFNIGANSYIEDPATEFTPNPQYFG